MIPLLAIRHAATAWNQAKRLQGRTDEPLAAEGEAAVRGWRLPPGWEGADCAASPLLRAMETARLLGLEPIPEPAVIEMAWGDWEGRTLVELRGELGSRMVEAEAKGLDLQPPGGESPRAVQARLEPWLAGLSRPTVAVTHKGVIRALYGLATGWDMREKPPLKLLPATAHHFTVTGGAILIERLNIPLEAA